MKRTVILVVLAMCALPVSAVQTKKVLWDASHGICDNYDQSGYFSQIVQNLTSNGFTVNTSNQGVLDNDLASYDVLVVCTCNAWNTFYTDAEVACITNFVNNGGGLLIMGENPSCPNAYLNPVASAFGITLGKSAITADAYITSFTPHQIFDGVSQIYMRAAGGMTVDSSLDSLVWDSSTETTLVAAGTYGDGRIVALGDNNIFAQYITESDNEQFAINTFEYLAAPEPVTLCLLGLGGLLLKRRRA